MNPTSTHFVPSRRMGIYEPIHQVGMWGDFKGNDCLDASPPMILEVENQVQSTGWCIHVSKLVLTSYLCPTCWLTCFHMCLVRGYFT